jgi:hypothetical protein
MPRLSEAKKDVIGCDKLRVGAYNRLVVDFRMGQPIQFIEWYNRKPAELKHLSKQRKRK